MNLLEDACRNIIKFYSKWFTGHLCNSATLAFPGVDPSLFTSYGSILLLQDCWHFPRIWFLDKNSKILLKKDHKYNVLLFFPFMVLCFFFFNSCVCIYNIMAVFPMIVAHSSSWKWILRSMDYFLKFFVLVVAGTVLFSKHDNDLKCKCNSNEFTLLKHVRNYKKHTERMLLGF